MALTNADLEAWINRYNITSNSMSIGNAALNANVQGIANASIATAGTYLPPHGGLTIGSAYPSAPTTNDLKRALGTLTHYFANVAAIYNIYEDKTEIRCGRVKLLVESRFFVSNHFAELTLLNAALIGELSVWEPAMDEEELARIKKMKDNYAQYSGLHISVLPPE